MIRFNVALRYAFHSLKIQCANHKISTALTSIAAVVIVNYRCWRILKMKENKGETRAQFIHSDSARKISSEKMFNYLPYYASGKIVPGFQRGSKELGIPTANYPREIVQALPEAFPIGVYYGWANIDNGAVFKMVMSIGWNPFYVNKEKSMETHIIHNYDRDLYGCLLKVCIVGYLRNEMNFKSVDALIAAIRHDIERAEELLDNSEEHCKLKQSEFFKEDSNISAVASCQESPSAAPSCSCSGTKPDHSKSK